MVEKKQIIKKKISYSGPFSVHELYEMCREWIKENSYNHMETSHKEKVLEAGKEIIIKLEPEKKVSEYVKFVVEIELKMKNVQSIIIEIDGKERKLNKGDVDIEITGKLFTDIAGAWETKPYRLFLRGIFEKYILGEPMTGLEKTLIQEVEYLRQQVEAHLNLFKKR